MGTQLSFDKYQTNLETLLSTAPAVFAKVAPQYQEGGAHPLLKIWRIACDAPSEELNLLDPTVQLLKSDSYVVLFARPAHVTVDKVGLPGELRKLVESVENVNEGGRLGGQGKNWTIALWHGKAVSQATKSHALLKYFDLSEWLQKDAPSILSVLLGGGRALTFKIKKGELSILPFQPDSALISGSPVVLNVQSSVSEADRVSFNRFTRFVETVQCEVRRIEGEVRAEKKTDEEGKAVIGKPGKPSFSLNLGATVSREEERRHITAKPNLTLADIEEDDDIRYTNRAQLKMEMFNTAISELYPGLFVAGDIIARDKALLRAKGITHVVNCAGNVCANYYPEDFNYLSYFLKDSNTESIECVFYETTQFIDKALESGGKVLVHCMQGVSRSVTVCLAYIIFKTRQTFDTVIKEAREKRGICSPNFGFQVQLMWWHKRLEGDSETLPFPRVFAVGSHENETPRKIVVRMLRTVPYSSGPEACKLDPRGVFLIHNPDVLYIWEGSSVHPSNLSSYNSAISAQVDFLQKYERAPTALIRVTQGREDAGFWESLKVSEMPAEAYRDEPAWNYWYAVMETAIDQEPKALGGDMSEGTIEKKAVAYVYPEVEGLSVFDEEELTDEAMVCLCRAALMHVWVGSRFIASDLSGEAYRNEVLSTHWGDRAHSVTTIDESPGRESEDFLSFF